MAEPGADAGPIGRFTSRARAGEFGQVDRIVVVRDGWLVIDETTERNDRAISRGRSGALGCGKDACVNDSKLHAYDYPHPDFHPWGPGRDVQTLQSITKRGTPTIVAVAIERGSIAEDGGERQDGRTGLRGELVNYGSRGLSGAEGWEATCTVELC